MKTSLSSAWWPRDIGFFYRVVDASRCKRSQANVEATFMGEAPWTAMTCSISRSKWKLRRMQNASYAALRNGHLLHLKYKAASLADSSPASVPLPLRVEPKPKSGIRQQDLLKKVVEIKPKRLRVSSPSDGNQSTPISSVCASTNLSSEADQEKEKEFPLSRPNKAEETKVENPVKSLLGLAYENSDEEED